MPPLILYKEKQYSKLKNKVKYLLLGLLSLTLIFSAGFSQESGTDNQLLTYAVNQLPQCGQLRQHSNGFVYVDVDDNYIYGLIPFIRSQGFEPPPYFEDGVGAHITVIYPEEITQYAVGNIEECGKIIYFALKDCKIVQPKRWKEMDEVFFITVNAPELAEIRKKYGLPLREYEFHITIGVKSKMAALAA